MDMEGSFCCAYCLTVCVDAVGHLAFQCRNDLSRAEDAQSAPVHLDVESTSSEESEDDLPPRGRSGTLSSDEGEWQRRVRARM